MGVAEEEIQEQNPDEDRVFAWRFEVLFKLGFAPSAADRIAKTDIELAAIRALKAQGCPLDLIPRILADTSPFTEVTLFKSSTPAPH
jgi:hypothetical protein